MKMLVRSNHNDLTMRLTMIWNADTIWWFVAIDTTFIWSTFH